MSKKAERELKDIVVTNVDLVDRAANEEQFAVVKRKEGRGMADKTKVKKDEETEEEKVAGEVAGAAETETDTEASTDEGGDDKSAVAKTAEAVTGLTARLDSLLDHLEKKGKTSKQDEDEEDVTKADGIKMAKDALAAALVVKNLPADAKAKIESAIALLDKMKANGYGYPKPTEAKKSESVVGDAEAVAKAGRILSKANLGKLQTAAKAMNDATETITSMLKQAMGTTDEEEDEEAKSKTKKAKAKKQDDEEDETDVEAKKAKGKKAEKAEDEDEEVKKSLLAISDSLTKISKRLDDAEAAVGITKSLGDGEDAPEGETVKKSQGGLWAGLGLVPGR